MALVPFRLARVILFVRDVKRVSAFYRDVLGLPAKADADEWVEFDVGGCSLALHRGGAEPGRKPPKIVFGSHDLDGDHARLAARGVACGRVRGAPPVRFFDITDPEGNVIQFSTRP